MKSTTSPHIDIEMSNEDCGRFRIPLLTYLPNDRKGREAYRKECIPLYNLALQGNWKEASRMLEKNQKLRTEAITKGWKTILHVAAGTHHVHFVEELVKFMDKDELELQDYNGNTALFSAAATGNLQIAEILIKKNESLPTIRGKESVTAIQLAALQGKREMTWYLYGRTIPAFTKEDWNRLFLACVKNGIYDLALEMSITNRSLAFTQDENEQTGLHILAHKQFTKSCATQTTILKLVGHLWEVILSDEDSEEEIRRIIRNPLFDAAKVGNFEFLAQLLSTYHPADLLWELDEEGRSIIHIAVLHRHAKIFNLIHKIGSIKDVIVTFEDTEENNLLHCAAMLAPSDQLNLISGAAFQMMNELMWFEEVKKVMQPSYIEKKNSSGLTPRELFSVEHQEPLKKAKSWMERTASSCMFISTVIATGVLSAAFSIPVCDNNAGIPDYLKKPAFIIFAVSEATTLIFASSSTLIFLSILISRYAEKDFLSSLPLKLIFGLQALFISISISLPAPFRGHFTSEFSKDIQWQLETDFMKSVKAEVIERGYSFLERPNARHVMKLCKPEYLGDDVCNVSDALDKGAAVLLNIWKVSKHSSSIDIWSVGWIWRPP
ncbi:hypothetical protein L6164_017509 [Bauhinia variegata]|uniref:Uncharacterized protein n=1 Tax=Bauhinia variegata TaxID=167791 RepID=A0ACB9ND36_BAUVA|nr:hypothetical protein L6164_017509 [Bauhinia variegata]